MKLSELLEAVAENTETVGRYRLSTDSYERCARTLRTIAPALVEAFQIMGNHYQAHPHSNCPSCRLFAVLKAAGVTCE